MDPHPRYSVLFTSRNEGERLRKTVDDVLRNAPTEDIEIVIVDDASDDGSGAFVTDAAYADKPIRAVRNESRRGLIYNRARAAELARGKYLTFLDAHCAVSPGWLEGLSEELQRIDGRGLVVPAVYTLRTRDWTIDLESRRTSACTISPFLDFSWTTPTEIEGKSCTCTIGGMTWMCTAEWYHRIGGLDRGMIVWGLENVDVPLRTWVAGGWCLVAENVKIGHLYKEAPTLRLNDVDYVYNKIRAAHNVFTAETFKKVMKSLVYLAGFREALTRIHEEVETITPFKDRFESIRKRPDSWLVDAFQLPLLEAPSYHLAPRRPKPPSWDARTPRPSVSVIVPVDKPENLEPLLSSLFERRTYGRCDILVAVDEPTTRTTKFEVSEPWRSHPCVRIVRSSDSPGGAPEENAATAGRADFLAFLPADTVAVDEHWIEAFLLLFERRPRLLMACPRTCWQAGPESGSPAEETFERTWDWDAPGFFRDRVGQPLEENPYQVFSCPETPLFVNRRALEKLGGFDTTLDGRPSVADLAIRGWLSGFEVFCHPGVSVVRQGPATRSAGAESSIAAPQLAYGRVLPAAKYFTSSRRGRCMEMCPDAEPLLRRNTAELETRRAEFLSEARFDDDWLFFKFNVEVSR